jgi:hypothetical protein
MSTSLEILRSDLIAKARARHGANIRPTAGRSSLNQCFSVFNGKLVLWYNDESASTHIEAAHLSTAQSAAHTAGSAFPNTNDVPQPPTTHPN